MPSTSNEQVVDTINSGNLKMLADMAQSAMGLSIQNQVSQQQRVSEMANTSLQNGLLMAQAATQNGLNIAQAVAARAARFTFDLSAEQASAFSQELSANLTNKLSDIGGQLASLQEQAKIAQTTPPQTGTGGAFGSDSGSALTQQLANLSGAISAIQTMLASGGKA